jgi:phosphoglycerate dehydrogenase-like enzyme
LPAAPRLGFIQSPVAGHDRIDFTALPAGCKVANVFEHDVGVSEHALLAMLEWQIRLRAIEARFRAGSWQDGVSALGPTHGELMGKTIGVIGVGHIARAIAVRATPFGTRLIGVTRTPKPEAGFEWVRGMTDLQLFLAECDFVVVACPLSSETTDLIAAAELACCKPTAVIMNFARGLVVNEDALYDALRSKQIGGAVIDVWYNNPPRPGVDVAPSKHPFDALDNVIMTPHSSSWSDGLLPWRWAVIAENLENFADDKPLRNLVRRPA